MSEDGDRERGLTRRRVLAGGGLAGASALAAAGGYLAAREVAGDDGGGGASAAAPDRTGGPLFELDPRYVNLTSFVLASHPRPVREAIERHRKRLDRNTALYLREAEVALEDASRSALAGYLGVKPDEVALTDSTTMGVALVYARMSVGPGDEVVTSEHDFFATHESLRLRQELDGVTVRRLRLYHDPESASVDRIVPPCRARSARARAHWRSRGSTPPAASSCRCARSPPWWPAQTAAALSASASSLRRRRARLRRRDASTADAGHRRVRLRLPQVAVRPAGTGFLWATPALAPARPTIPSFDPASVRRVASGTRRRDAPPGALLTPGGFHSFEHRWAVAEAVDVHGSLGGRAAVARRTHARAAELKDGLAGIDGVRLRTPRDAALSAGLVCCEVRGIDPGDVVDRLREERRVVASVTPYRVRYVRFGPSVANRAGDVRRGIEAVAAIAKRA